MPTRGGKASAKKVGKTVGKIGKTGLKVFGFGNQGGSKHGKRAGDFFKGVGSAFGLGHGGQLVAGHLIAGHRTKGAKDKRKRKTSDWNKLVSEVAKAHPRREFATNVREASKIYRGM